MKWRDQARSDFSRDVEKGEKVFPDYSFSHPDNDEKLGFINQEYGKALDRCKTLMKLIEVWVVSQPKSIKNKLGLFN